MSDALCHMSDAMCRLSPVTCYMSLTQSATAMDPPTALAHSAKKRFLLSPTDLIRKIWSGKSIGYKTIYVATKLCKSPMKQT